MEIDIPIKDLVPYLPHRPPMVWIDRVSEVGKDYKGLTGTCIVKIQKGALFLNDNEAMRASAAIEFTAQSFGYLKAAYQVTHQFNDPPSKTYLTGVRSCEADFSSLEMSEGKELEVKVSVIREILPLTYIKGEIFEKGAEHLLASAEIQVYVD